MTPRELALRASSPRLICVTAAVAIWPAAVVWNLGEKAVAWIRSR